MANLFDALHISDSALRALQSALEASQNNISNASTSGYARQRVNLTALPANPLQGAGGGVRAAGVLDSRNGYAESAVWRQTNAQGYQNGLARNLGILSAQFEVSGDTGIPGAMNRFFQSASAWSVAPGSITARQDFLRSAGALADSFADTSASLGRIASELDPRVEATVARINGIGAELAELNKVRMRSSSPDPAVDARIYSALEELSSLTDFTTVQASDGSMTVLAGGQTPLVLGGQAQSITASNSHASLGELGGLLRVRDEVLPAVRTDLDRLAAAIADRANTILDGPLLFSYTAGSAAATLSIAAGVTASGLPAEVGTVSNGVPLALAQMADLSDGLDGMAYSEFYGALGGRVGRMEANASEAAARQNELVVAARGLRDEVSGVSLDEEAIMILQYQRGYQAAAQMVRVIDEMTQTVIGMIG